jgi:hypothetical protein
MSVEEYSSCCEAYSILRQGIFALPVGEYSPCYGACFQLGYVDPAVKHIAPWRIPKLWRILPVGEYSSSCGAHCQLGNTPLVVEHIDSWGILF